MQVAEDTRLARAANLQKKIFPKFRKNNVVYAASTDIWIDFTSMISHVKSYALKYIISGNFFSQENLQGCLVPVGNGIELEAVGLQFEPTGGALVV